MSVNNSHVKVVALVENRSNVGCAVAHGLSLYIETKQHKVLFDVGGDDTFLRNSTALGVDIAEVDTVIISHGHKDHGGALSLFLQHNTKATVYIQRTAFAPHFSHRPSGVGDISLDCSLMNSSRVVLLDGEHIIDDELALIKVSDNSKCRSAANGTLFEGEKPDNFDHEQNLIINAPIPILVMGCGHNGVVNIMRRAAQFRPAICIGGFHLTNPSAKRDEPQELIDEIIAFLANFPATQFYTCHCTGWNVYNYMLSKMDNIHYLSCGDKIEI